MGQRLRLATWNIGGGFTAARHPLDFDTEDLAYFAKALQSLACDFICLQEVHSPMVPGRHSQAELLAQMLSMPHCEVTPYGPACASPFRDDQLLSLAIVSRWETRASRYAMLPNPMLQIQVRLPTASADTVWGTHDKGFLGVDVVLADQGITVLTGHTVPFELFRRDAMEEEFAAIRAAAEEIVLASGNRPTIVAGDLNYGEIERLLPRVFQAGYRRVLQGVATEPRHDRQRDHILVSPHWRVANSGVIPGQADHYLCYADLVLPA